ncbi:MAG: CocE/NonD family hydrolase [Syntrophobacteraceae bacterium]|jgi:putative CocE/NonD family hydrolase
MEATTILKVVGFIGVVSAVVVLFFIRTKNAHEYISRLGAYSGYTHASYDGYQRRSTYLTLANGTRLAYDLYLPTMKGVPATARLPVLFKYTPYLRTFTIFDKAGNNIIAGLFDLGWKERAYLRLRYWLHKEGYLMDQIFRVPFLKNMLRHGYAVIVVERPGTGSSFGIMDASFEAGIKEVDEILNWISDREWCDGNIGMYGDSFQAMIQFVAAASGNEHLKAIFPVSSGFDMYSGLGYPGGIYNKTFAAFFSWSTSFLERVATPVDDDKDGTVLRRIQEERRDATLAKQSEAWLRGFPFRDSATEGGVKVWEGPANLYPLMDRINRSGIPVYMTAGWYDLFSGARDMLLWYANLTLPKRLLIRPVDHSQVQKNGFDINYGVEAHRWFDYWLKGIDNGIMKEEPLQYYVMGAGKNGAWRTTARWPLPTREAARFYCGPGRTGSVASANDGLLSPKSPSPADGGADDYRIDYSTTSGSRTRWNAVNWSRNYPDMTPNDTKALTYTTAPMASDTEITGHPTVSLWFLAAAPDVDFFVYLEEVGDTRSTYVTEGSLRASHRTLSEAPFANPGMVYHAHRRSELEPVSAGEPTPLVFNLLPVSHVFRAGNRIRVTITCADADNFETPSLEPAPEIRLLRDPAHASCVDLPVISHR